MVYVNPEKRAVIGPVEWLPSGKVKEMEKVIEEKEGDEGKRKGKKRKIFYPWCSYRTAKRVYNVEGKIREEENHQKFDDVLKRALEEPFWD